MLLTPPTRAARRLRGADRTRGAAAVEAAIVLPVVITLFVGMVEFGLIFRDLLALSAGVQAGARRASIEPLLTSTGQFAADASAEVSGAIGGVNLSGSPDLYVYDPTAVTDPRGGCGNGCLSFTWSASVSGGGFTSTGGSWDPCRATPPARDVGVMVVLRHQGVTSFPWASPTLVQSAVYRFDSTGGSLCQ